MSGPGEKPNANEDRADEARSDEDPGDWRKIEPYLSLLDFAATPTSKAAWFVRAGVTAVMLVVGWKSVSAATSPMLKAKPPTPIPVEAFGTDRFLLTERVRRDIFAELAAAELAERARAIAANTWKGHLWSREDDRGYREMVVARGIAAKHRISLSQVYLVLDEGIRERWPGPDGKPLPATTPPLNMRWNAW